MNPSVVSVRCRTGVAKMAHSVPDDWRTCNHGNDSWLARPVGYSRIFLSPGISIFPDRAESVFEIEHRQADFRSALCRDNRTLRDFQPPVCATLTLFLLTGVFTIRSTFFTSVWLLHFSTRLFNNNRLPASFFCLFISIFFLPFLPFFIGYPARYRI